MFAEEFTSKIILNGQSYNIGILLSNPDKHFPIPIMLFKGLSVDERLDSWAFTGYLDLQNTYEQLERFTKGNEDEVYDEIFYFRMDGSDEIEIYLSLDVDPETKRKIESNQISSNLMDNAFLWLSGSIYDTQSIDVDGDKIKRIYFWDKYYNKSIDVKAHVSSGEYQKTLKERSGDDIRNLTDFERSSKPSALLKYTMDEKLGAPTDSTNWSSSSNSILYNTPSNYRINDIINYLINHHSSDPDHYPAVLVFNRFSRKYEFKSFDDIFSKYSNDTKEMFTFPDNVRERGKLGPSRIRNKNIYDLNSASAIRSYDYTRMAGMDNVKGLVSNNITVYNPKTKTFDISCKENSISNGKIKLRQLVVDKMQRPQSSPLITLNNRKINNTSFEEHYFCANDEEGRETCGIKDILRAAIYLNDCIDFNVIGSPLRTSGTFIEIMSDVDLRGIWEDRFLGTWLVVSVNHNVTTNSYENNITAVKLNSMNKFDFPEDIGEF